MTMLNCPVCGGAMREINRDGVLIDTCTQCRGVWLDRGELEKLSAQMGDGSGRRWPGSDGRRDRDRYDDDDDDDRYRRNAQAHQPSKMKRFLDFFD